MSKEKDNVVYMPVPETLTLDQRQHWQDQAAYWAVREEDAYTALEVAQRNRESCLRMLGMLAAERGVRHGG